MLACVCVCVSWGVSASGLVGREVCVCAVSAKRGRGHGDDWTRDRGARCGRTSDDAQSSRSKLMALAAAWRDGFLSARHRQRQIIPTWLDTQHW